MVSTSYKFKIKLFINNLATINLHLKVGINNTLATYKLLIYIRKLNSR